MKDCIENRIKIKELVTNRFEGHNVFCNPDLFIDRIDPSAWSDTDTFVVVQNIEIVYTLLTAFDVQPENITYWHVEGDDDLKIQWCQAQGVKYSTLDLEDSTIKKIDYMLMNPAFDISVDCLNLARKIVNKKIYYIGPTQDFDRKDALVNLEYFESLGNKAFDENTTTAFSVYNQNGTDKVTFAFEDGRTHVADAPVTDVPTQNNLDDYIFAQQVKDLDLPGYEAKCATLYDSHAQEDPNGILCVFTMGKEGDKEYGNQKMIPKSQLDKTLGYGEHKIAISKIGTIGKLGAIKYVPPGVACGSGCYRVIMSSKKEALDTIKYLKSDKVAKLVRGFKTKTPTNGSSVWARIPQMQYDNQW